MFITKNNSSLNKKKTISKLNKNLIYLIKDNFWTKDFFTKASSNFLQNYYINIDSKVVELLEEKKYNVIGKTEMDELSCGGTGTHSAKGILHNPNNKKLIVGGSSSGSAIAVYNDIVTFSIGSDTGGSIRQPASFCGLIGFKPSYGAISRYGMIPMCSSMDTIGIISKKIDIIINVFNILNQTDSNDLFTFINKKERLRKNNENDNKIAIFKDIEHFLSDEIKEEYHKFLINLKVKLKLKIFKIKIPNIIKNGLYAGWLQLCFSELFSHLSSLKGITFGAKDDTISIEEKRDKFIGEVVKKRILLGSCFLSKTKQIYCVYLWKKKLISWLNKLFKNFNFLIHPTTTGIAPYLKDVIEDEQNSTNIGMGSNWGWAENLILLANIFKSPSISIPFKTKNNNFFGININADKKNDEKLLNFIKFLEKFKYYYQN